MTNAMDPDVLARLVDRQQIYDCLMRYVRGVDRVDLGLIRSAFWEDAIITQGPVRGSADDFIASWQPAQAGRESSFHNVSNLSVELDGNSAHCEAYLQVTIKQKASDSIEMVGGRYIDHFEKRGSEWRIKTRLMVIDWQGMMDASQMAARQATRHRGSRDRNDPSYERPIQPRDPIDTPWLPPTT